MPLRWCMQDCKQLIHALTMVYAGLQETYSCPHDGVCRAVGNSLMMAYARGCRQLTHNGVCGATGSTIMMVYTGLQCISRDCHTHCRLQTSVLSIHWSAWLCTQTHSCGSAYDIMLECPGSKAVDSFANKVYNSSGLIPSPFLLQLLLLTLCNSGKQRIGKTRYTMYLDVKWRSSNPHISRIFYTNLHH